jgi:AAA domain
MADQKPKYTYQLIDPDDIKTVIATEYLIEDFLVLREITFVFGAPKQFKTFLILAALLCVAMGIDFFGRKVAQRKVVYMIGEGGDAFIGRVKAWQTLHNVPSLQKNFLVLPRTVNLFEDSDVRKAVAEVEAQGFRPDVAVIDTLGRAMGDADEKTKDFNKIFANLDRLRQDYWPGLTEIVLSHTKKGELVFRGPQVIAGNGDNLMYVIRIGQELKANVTCEGGFCRNAREFETFGFTLAAQPVLTNKGMQDFLVVNALTAAAKTDAEANKKAGKEERQEELDELMWITALALSRPPERVIQYTAWYEVTKAKRGGKLGTTTFSDAVKRLCESGQVRKVGELYQVVLDGHGAADEAGTPEAGVDPATFTPTPDSSPSKGGGVPGVRSKTPKSTPGSSGVTSTESGSDQNKVVPKAPPDDGLEQVLENYRLLKEAVDQLLKKSNGKPSAR